MVLSRDYLSSGNWTTDPSTGKQYLVMDLDGSLSHDRYRDLCAKQGGKLPEPRNEEENNFLVSLDLDMFVLGINDKKVEGRWVYDSDSSPLTWFYWFNGTRNQFNYRWYEKTNLNCVMMVRTLPGSLVLSTWSIYRCESKMFDVFSKQLVCERQGLQGNII